MNSVLQICVSSSSSAAAAAANFKLGTHSVSRIRVLHVIAHGLSCRSSTTSIPAASSSQQQHSPVTVDKRRQKAISCCRVGKFEKPSFVTGTSQTHHAYLQACAPVMSQGKLITDFMPLECLRDSIVVLTPSCLLLNLTSLADC